MKGITVDAERLATYREQGKCRKKEEAETAVTPDHLYAAPHSHNTYLRNCGLAVV
jgi:hypothetical protein